MIPSVASVAYSALIRNVPTRIRNSPTNPFSPGRPMDDRVTIRKAAVKTGMIRAKPPKSWISRVWRRSYSIPTRRKSAPVDSP